MESHRSRSSTARARTRAAADGALIPRGELITRVLGVRFDPCDPRAHALERALDEGDPLADGVVEMMRELPQGVGRALFERALSQGIDALAEPPAALMSLFRQLDSEPPWLDRELAALGGRTMLRHGRDGLCALSGASLMGGYLSSIATKPLAGTGALTRLAPQRLAATTKFTRDVATSSGLLRFSEGFKTSVRVRLMHALVRRSLLASAHWRREAWGVPINQRDMVATHLQFTVTYLGGVCALGRLDTSVEREAVMHLWRYVGHLLGTRDELLPRSFREGVEIAAIFNATEPGPDQDGRALAKALVTTWFGGPAERERSRLQQLVGSFLLGYSRYALGDAAAERLELPDTRWKYVPPLLAALRLPLEAARLVWPDARARAVRTGQAEIERMLALSLGGWVPEHLPYPQAA